MLFKQTVDSIIVDITKKVEQLKAVAELHHIAAEAHSAKAAFRTKLAADLRMERDRARAIASKLASLVNPSTP